MMNPVVENVVISVTNRIVMYVHFWAFRNSVLMKNRRNSAPFRKAWYAPGSKNIEWQVRRM